MKKVRLSVALLLILSTVLIPFTGIGPLDSIKYKTVEVIAEQYDADATTMSKEQIKAAGSLMEHIVNQYSNSNDILRTKYTKIRLPF